MQTSSYTNIAFISYKREDEEWAKWLQKKLEHYKLPTEIRKQNPNLEFAKNPRHVFKDTTDLSGGVLAKAIKEGLDSSKFLIVICSPRAAKSEWVCKEVQDFIDSGREENIIPFIIDGEPYAKNPEIECFPEALKTLAGERELLGININENGRESATVKTIARMFDVRFDTLWQRFQREERKRRQRGMLLLSAFLIISLGVIYGFYVQNQNIEESKNEIIKERDRANAYANRLSNANDSIKAAYAKLGISEKNLEKSNLDLRESNSRLAIERDNVLKANWKMMESRARAVAEKAKELIQHGNLVKGVSLLLEIMPQNLKNPEKPFVYEMEQVFRLAYDSLLYGRSPLWTMSGHEGVQTSASFSPNSQYVLTSSNDKTARIWNVKSGQELTTYRMKHDEAINYATYSLKDEVLTSGYGNQVKRWRLSKNKVYDDGFVINGKEPVYSSNAKYVVIKDGKYAVAYDATSFKRVFNDDPVCTEIAFGNKLDIRALLTKEALIVIKDENGKTVNTIDVSDIKDYVYQIVFSPGDDVLMLHTKRKLFFWNINNAMLCSEINDVDIEGANFSADDIHIVTRTSDYGQVKFWNYHTGKEIESLRLYYDEHPFVRNASFSRNNKYLLTSTFDGVTRVYKNPLIVIPEKNTVLYESNVPLKFNSNSTVIESIPKDGNYSWFSLGNVEDVCSIPLKAKNNGIHCTSQSLTGLIAVCYWGAKDYVDIVDIHKCKIISTIKIDNSAFINSICISPEGTYLAVASNDSFAHIYEIRTGKLLHKLSGHSNGVITCKFSYDEQSLITASHDHTSRLWNVKSGKEYFKYLFASELYNASLSPSKDKIIASGWDGIHIIDIGSGVQVYHYPIYTCLDVAMDTHESNLYFILEDEEDDSIHRVTKMEYPNIERIISYLKSQMDVYHFTPKEKKLYYLE